MKLLVNAAKCLRNDIEIGDSWKEWLFKENVFADDAMADKNNELGKYLTQIRQEISGK